MLSCLELLTKQLALSQATNQILDRGLEAKKHDKRYHKADGRPRKQNLEELKQEFPVGGTHIELFQKLPGGQPRT